MSMDDQAFLYLGTNALAPTSSNYNLFGKCCSVYVSYTVTLTGGSNYPFLVYWGQGSGSHAFGFDVTSPSGVSRKDLFFNKGPDLEAQPTQAPTAIPSTVPSVRPTAPTAVPTARPTPRPSYLPSANPSTVPSVAYFVNKSPVTLSQGQYFFVDLP